MVASMAWTMWSFYGLNYAFAYACFHDASMGHYTWYLVPCNELLIWHNPKDFFTVVLSLQDQQLRASLFATHPQGAKLNIDGHRCVHNELYKRELQEFL
jgi:hypothetical protein